MQKFKLSRVQGVLVAVALSPVAAFAQSSGVDTSSVTAQLTAAATAGGIIGLAYLAMVAGIKLYKWVRSAM
jgi:uncharacterized membrane-anchored protein